MVDGAILSVAVAGRSEAAALSCSGGSREADEAAAASPISLRLEPCSGVGEGEVGATERGAATVATAVSASHRRRCAADLVSSAAADVPASSECRCRTFACGRGGGAAGAGGGDFRFGRM